MVVPSENDEHLWEITIETLTGSSFKVHVLPTDKIISLKMSIQRVEGIPVSQQHLLYNFVELDNSSTLKDYRIPAGATLKLILSMRGGPISTRRLPAGAVEEMAWRELQQLIADMERDEEGRENIEASEGVRRLSNGLTVLVVRDGEQVNLIRVLVDDEASFGDDPDEFSESAGLRTLFDENDPQESAQRLRENSITMLKMQQIKEKLEQLSLSRRDKKPIVEALTVTEHEEIFGSPTSTSSRASPPLLTTASVEEPAACAYSSNRLVDTETDTDDDDLGYSSSIRRPCGSLLSILGTDRRETNQSSSHGSSSDGSFYLRKGTQRISLGSYSAALDKARKEAENIIRLQSKSLSVFVDHHGFSKHSPLPEIRRNSSRLPSAAPSTSHASVAFATSPAPVVSPSSRLVCDAGKRRRKLAAIVDLSKWPTSSTTAQSDTTTVSQPVKEEENQSGAAIDEDVPKKVRCVHCRKRLNITTSYSCRCGGVFCLSHRYPEVHSCQFDYKGEGRRLLRAANPLVQASKLPKI